MALFRGSWRLLAHALPELGFPISGGVPPTLSAHQVDLHYNKHHKAYVDKLNALTAGTDLANASCEDIIKNSSIHVGTVLFNQAGQHYNHSFYWKCLRPNGVPDIPAPLSKMFEEHFGGFDKFKTQFCESAVGNFGSGWTWCCYDPATKKVVITNTSNADCPLRHGLVPILTCDVWEHAYYVDFENRRPDYLQIVDWEQVNEHWLLAAATPSQGVND